MQDLIHSKEFNDWYSDSFERGINDGYRYFPKDSIKLDIENRVLTFSLKNEEKNIGSPDFLSRVKTDTYFKNNFAGNFKNNFSEENAIFNLSKKPQNHNIELGGRVAITETKLFIDNSGETYIAIPLAKGYETYSLSGKLTGAKIITGAGFVDTNKIVSKIRNSEQNPILELQEKYKKDLIIKELDGFKFGDWTVRFEITGGKYSQIKDVHIGRSIVDGAFEVLNTKMYKSYEDLLSSFKISENIGYDRALALVKLSDLLINEGGNLSVSKIFYDGEEKQISELPDEFKAKFGKNEETKFIKDFTKTPPLEIFIGRLKTLLLQDEFKKTFTDILSNMKAEKDFRQAQKESKQTGKNTEELILVKLGLDKNEESFYLEGTKDEFINKIKDKKLSQELENKLINFINSIGYDSIKIKLNPDSIYKKDGKIYFIEIKKSTDSIKSNQDRNLILAKYLLEDIGDIIYLLEDYKGIYTDEFGIKRIGMSELEEKGLNNLI